jgi:hypothetical protein
MHETIKGRHTRYQHGIAMRKRLESLGDRISDRDCNDDTIVRVKLFGEQFNLGEEYE